MEKDTSKQMLFEAMHKVTGMPLNEEEYPRGGGNSEVLKKFIYADRLLGEKMTEEQAIQILDDAKSQLGIGDMETFKANVTAGALYTLLSEYEGEMGGFNRY
jgi:hypothetical protein